MLMKPAAKSKQNQQIVYGDIFGTGVYVHGNEQKLRGNVSLRIYGAVWVMVLMNQDKIWHSQNLGKTKIWQK